MKDFWTFTKILRSLKSIQYNLRKLSWNGAKKIKRGK